MPHSHSVYGDYIYTLCQKHKKHHFLCTTGFKTSKSFLGVLACSAHNVQLYLISVPEPVSQRIYTQVHGVQRRCNTLKFAIPPFNISQPRVVLIGRCCLPRQIIDNLHMNVFVGLSYFCQGGWFSAPVLLVDGRMELLQS